MGQLIQHGHLGERGAVLPEEALHQQEAPAVGQGIVEEPEERAEAEVAVLDEAALRRQLERGQPERIAQKVGVVLEDDLAASSARPGFGEEADDALVFGPASQPNFELPHLRPRLTSGRCSLASSSAIDTAGGGWSTAAKSGSRSRAKAIRNRPWSETLPELSKRRSEARLTPDRSASVLCFHPRASRRNLARSARLRLVCSGVSREKRCIGWLRGASKLRLLYERLMAIPAINRSENSATCDVCGPTPHWGLRWPTAPATPVSGATRAAAQACQRAIAPSAQSQKLTSNASE